MWPSVIETDHGAELLHIQRITCELGTLERLHDPLSSSQGWVRPLRVYCRR